MKVLNLVRKFEMQRMKDYSDKFFGIVNKLSLAELLSALQAQEQRRMMRQEGSIDGALQAKLQFGSSAGGNKVKGKKGNYGSYEATTTRNSVAATNNNRESKYSPCQHCGRRNHPHF